MLRNNKSYILRNYQTNIIKSICAHSVTFLTLSFCGRVTQDTLITYILVFIINTYPRGVTVIKKCVFNNPTRIRVISLISDYDPIFHHKH